MLITINTEQISRGYEVEPRVCQAFGFQVVIERFLAKIEGFHQIF